MRWWRLLLVAVVGLVLGYGTGAFFAFERASVLVQNTPASPVIVGSLYDKEQHALVYLVSNPGGVPLQVVRHSLVFTPGEGSEEAGYQLIDVPTDVTLAPFSVAQVVIQLKTGTEQLQPGDVVAVTLDYTHPFSPDLYSVLHTTLIQREHVEGEQAPLPTLTPQPTPES